MEFNKKICPPAAKTPKALIPQLKRTDNLVLRRMNQITRANGVEDVTAMHGWILRYLEENADRDIFQRDVEKHFSITRSTVTNILQLMEKKGYIRREGVDHDARLKRLHLTEEGKATNEKLRSCFRECNRQLESCLTAEENTELMRLLAKLQAGLEAPAEPCTQTMPAQPAE